LQNFIERKGQKEQEEAPQEKKQLAVPDGTEH
jgi:hypothetical protein